MAVAVSTMYVGGCGYGGSFGCAVVVVWAMAVSVFVSMVVITAMAVSARYVCGCGYGGSCGCV